LYTSLILLGMGWSVGRWSGLAGISTVGMAWFLDAKARHEESWLQRIYPDYAEYRKRVCRFVPGIY
jgi:protein-S-isoprenylcysteine O-methyltransferase Ste14